MTGLKKKEEGKKKEQSQVKAILRSTQGTKVCQLTNLHKKATKTVRKVQKNKVKRPATNMPARRH